MSTKPRVAYIAWPCQELNEKLSADLSNIGFNVSVFDADTSLDKLKSIAEEGNLLILCFLQKQLEQLQDEVLELITSPSSPIIVIIPDINVGNTFTSILNAPYHFLTPDYTPRELSLCVASVCRMAESTVASQDLFKTMIEHSVDGIALIDREGKLLYTNTTIQDIFEGRNANNIELYNIRDFVAKQHLAILQQDIERVFATGEGQKLQLKGKTLKGREIWIESIGSIIPYKDTQVELVSLKDITTEKEAIEKLAKSEEKYRMMIENANDAIVFIQDEKIVFGNRQAMELFSYNHEDIFGKSFSSFIPPSEMKRVMGFYHKRLKGEDVPKIYETQIINSKGHTIDVDFNVNISVYRDKPTTVINIRDLSYRKQAELTVKNSQESYRELFESTSDAILVLDPSGIILDANRSAVSIFGYPRTDLLGNTLNFLSAQEKISTERIPEKISKAFLGESQLFEWWGKRSTSDIFPLEALLNKGTLFGLDVIFLMGRDITERKHQQQELIMAKERAEESDRLKTAFLSNMSHEIRSPMHAILGFLRLLTEEEHLTETGLQYVSQINSSGNQLICIIDDIIDISKIQANQLKLKYKDIDLNALMEELYSMYHTQLTVAGRDNVELRKPNLDLPNRLVIHSDELRLRQILTNLIGNAIKFTPEGHIEFGYKFISDGEKANIYIYVKDTGIGISKEVQKYIFDRFRQIDDSFTRVFGGAGLGLSISRGLVNLLGGKIWVESEVEAGSQFSLMIPYIPPQTPNETKARDIIPSSTRSDTGQWANFNILIVEDIQEIRFLLEKTLAHTGATMHFASNGEEAKQLFHQLNSIDLVLLDIRLPDTDGFILAKEFKSINCSIPIIAQTAYAMQEDREKCLQAGCDDYITKPINPRLLIKKASSLLAKVT